MFFSEKVHSERLLLVTFEETDLQPDWDCKEMVSPWHLTLFSQWLDFLNSFIGSRRIFHDYRCIAFMVYKSSHGPRAKTGGLRKIGLQIVVALLFTFASPDQSSGGWGGHHPESIQGVISNHLFRGESA